MNYKNNGRTIKEILLERITAVHDQYNMHNEEALQAIATATLAVLKIEELEKTDNNN